MGFFAKPTVLTLLILLFSGVSLISAQQASDSGAIKKFSQADKFRQLEEILPTPEFLGELAITSARLFDWFNL